MIKQRIRLTPADGPITSADRFDYSAWKQAIKTPPRVRTARPPVPIDCADPSTITPTTLTAQDHMDARYWHRVGR